MIRRVVQDLITQLRQAGIRDERLLQAMAAVPRENFVDEALTHKAYDNTALPIGYGQTISQPFMVAKMTELLDPRLLMPLLFFSTVLFYMGMAFAYFVVFPLAFGFFTSTAPQDVVIATDINNYLSFVMALFMAFGISFEVPIAIILLCWSGATTVASLKQKRPYILVGAFVVGMLLTPPGKGRRNYY